MTPLFFLFRFSSALYGRFLLFLRRKEKHTKALNFTPILHLKIRKYSLFLQQKFWKSMEEETSQDVKVRLERRKGITFNLELHKSPYGYPVFLRVSEGGQHKRFNTSIKLRRKIDWDSKRQKIKPSEPNYEAWQEVLDDVKFVIIDNFTYIWAFYR